MERRWTGMKRVEKRVDVSVLRKAVEVFHFYLAASFLRGVFSSVPLEVSIFSSLTNCENAQTDT